MAPSRVEDPPGLPGPRGPGRADVRTAAGEVAVSAVPLLAEQGRGVRADPLLVGEGFAPGVFVARVQDGPDGRPAKPCPRRTRAGSGWSSTDRQPTAWPFAPRPLSSGW